MGISDADRERIREAILAGHKIEAIKVWRELTGAGLTEAKAAVEAIEAELHTAGGRAVPGSAAPAGPQRRTGCLGVLAGLLWILSVMFILLWRAGR